MFNVSMFALRARAFRALHLSFSLRRSIFKRLTVGMLTTWALLGIQGLAQAQFRVEVSGVGITQIPINLNQFKDESVSPQKISQIIQADLERSAKFKVSGNSFAMDESSRPDFNALRQKALENFVTGSVTKLADGRFDVRFRLWDLIKAQDLGGASYAVVAPDLRRAAHQISDFIYEKLTGEKGVFSTRIAYVTKSANRFNLWIADADGENAQAALTSPEPIISPNWAPNGQQLAYVSFESRKPVVYVHDVATGKRKIVANFKGSNSAPSWSPDGQSLAVTLSRDGGSQIYLIASSGGEPQRLTQSSSIDTEPTFMPDGSAIYFVSDRGGSPQIYRMPAKGGPAARVTFNGTYNISPSLSPDGKLLAYISRQGGQFKLYLMDLATERTQALSETSADEKPSFAPNGKLIIYATQVQGKEALMTVNWENKISARLSGQSGDIREPHWGPFLKGN